MANRYSTETTTQLTPRQFLMLAANAFEKLDWPAQIQDGTTITAQTKVSSASFGEEISVTVIGSLVEIESKCKSSQLTDWGRNKKNVNQFLETLDSVYVEYSPEQLEQQFVQFETEAEENARSFKERYEQGQLTATDKLAIAHGGHYVTYSLIGLNILVFIAMVIGGVGIMDPDAYDIYKWGGNIRQYTAAGEWWRLITCVFVHIGIVHLLFNMYALFSIGIYLEPVIGRWNFLAAYLTTGALASLVSMWWSADRVSAGASGAIFGMYGFFLALLTTNVIEKRMRQSILQGIVVFVIYNLAMGMRSGVDNAAHVGGLVSGFVFGYAYYLMHRKSKTKVAFIPAALFITVALCIPVLNGKSDDTVKFQEVLMKFAVLEEKGLRPFRNAQDVSREEFASQVETIAMPAFTEAKAMLKETSTYKLPEKALKQRELLTTYVDLRILQLEAALKMDETENPDTTDLQEISGRIDATVKALEAISSK